MKETICAISTPPGIGGIAVIRVSGPQAKTIVSRVITDKGKSFEHGKFFHTYIKNPETKEIIEEAVVSYFQAPKSFTGEDVVELTVHGGIYSPQSVLNLLIKNGAKLAEPGEFTRRAFLNKKMDLLQVQALLDLIKARSELQVKFAISKLHGDLSKKLSDLRDLVFELLKETEARVEFEEDVPPLDMQQFGANILKILAELEKLLEEGERNALIFEGVQVAIAGKPNVGKSSLFNSIVRRERAIVTPVPGTTRDVIHEEFFLEGIPVKLYDTAGMRESEEVIESIGVRKAQEIIDSSHLVLFVVDGSNPLEEEDFSLWTNLKKERVVVVNKNDLIERANIKELQGIEDFPIVRISCLTGEGIDSLEKILKEKVRKYILPSSEISLSGRERQLLQGVKKEIEEAHKKIGMLPLDIVSFHLQRAFNLVNEVFGWGEIPDRILNTIFKDFCVGK